MRNWKLPVESVVGSVVITLVTGAINSTPSNLVGALWYGYPWFWLTKRIIAPQYFPYFVNWTGLVVDLAFWFIVVWLVLFLSSYVRHGHGVGKKAAQRKRRRR
ncbi:MAG: hypothetical protein KGH69_01330 [Candidatus Micrarchaeota archaeon]|nr:hypothetical protein [Candidatus Micrarchaeota archaeon]